MKFHTAVSEILFQLILILSIGNGNETLPTQGIVLNPTELKSLVESDIKVIQKLEDLVGKQLLPKYVADLALSYIADFKDTVMYLEGHYNDNEDKLVRTITRNPIAAYRFLHRIVNHLQDLKEKLEGLSGVSEIIMEALSCNERLSQDDVHEIMSGLLRIQYVYDLNPKTIADGVISGINTGTKLHTVHCYQLGIWASRNNFHILSIEWLEVALMKSSQDRTMDGNLIQAALQLSIEKHDNFFNNRWEFDPHFYNRKLLPRQRFNNLSDTLQSQRMLLGREVSKYPKSQFGFSIRFWEMCSKGSLKIADGKKDENPMKCFYETKVNLYWTISPLKMELLSRDPQIYQIYDILTDGKIQILENLVKHSFQRSTVKDAKRSGINAKKIVSTRTSVGAKFDEREVPGLEILPEVIQLATGLSVTAKTAGEDLQVAAYAFGGHYDVHIDYFDPSPKNVRGGRVATFMFYLLEPEFGGYTVFTEANAVAKPVKGSAVVWHNVLSDGSPDLRTYHGACPVVLGEKWVANKWIRINDQFKVRKCSRDRNRGYVFPYEKH